MRNFRNQVETVFSIVFCAFKHAQEKQRDTKQAHRMPLSRKGFDRRDHFFAAAGPLLQVFVKLLDFIWSAFFAEVKKVDHLDRIPVCNLRDRLVDVEESFLWVDIGCRAITDRNAS